MKQSPIVSFATIVLLGSLARADIAPRPRPKPPTRPSTVPSAQIHPSRSPVALAGLGLTAALGAVGLLLARRKA
jgi:hypothetical protein